MNVCVVGYGMMGVWHSEALAEEERDFVAALEQGRQPAVPGRAVLPTMRLLQDVQDRWDAVHGRRSLPGRPLDEEEGEGA